MGFGRLCCHDSRPGAAWLARSARGARATGRGLVFAAIAGLCLAAAAPRPAAAGELRGEIKFEPRNLGAPPVRNQGFIERIENPLRPIRSFDPHAELVVVLDGGPVDEEGARAPAAAVRYRLVGASFEVPLLPVVVQTRVELENRSPRAQVLFTPDDPDLVDEVTLKPRSFHELRAARAHEVIEVRSPDAVHLVGRIVAFPHRYFATVDRRGRFEIKDVPDGTWTVKLWYRDRWIDGVEASVEIGKRRADVTLAVPPAKLRANPDK